MLFQKEYFQQIFGIMMETNLAPFLENLYLSMLEQINSEEIMVIVLH